MTEIDKKADKIVLETNKRLSESMLWSLQAAAYCQFGPKAWKSKGVPFYITSNPFIARQYALVVLGYLRDLIRQGALDVSQPFYIFDLGAGTGRFGYLFMKSLNEILGVLHRHEIQVRYVMTDIATDNMTFWRSHPYLQGLIKAKMLDFAYYHHAMDEESIKLVLSEETLTPEMIKNPRLLSVTTFLTRSLRIYSGLKKGNYLKDV